MLYNDTIFPVMKDSHKKADERTLMTEQIRERGGTTRNEQKEQVGKFSGNR